jgi:hypothetical protein
MCEEPGHQLFYRLIFLRLTKEEVIEFHFSTERSLYSGRKILQAALKEI